MAIKKITYAENGFINKGTISFDNSNVISLIGMNGSGKSQLLKWLSEGKDGHEYKKVIAKSQRAKILKMMGEYMSKGTNKKDFDQISEKLLNESTTVKDIKSSLDTFIWNWYSKSLFPVLKNQVTDNEYKTFKKAYEELMKTKMFTETSLNSLAKHLDDYDRLDEIVPYKRSLSASDEIISELSKMFDKTSIVHVDTSIIPAMSGRLQRSPLDINKVSLSKTFMTDKSFRFPLMLLRSAGYDLKLFSKHAFSSPELAGSLTTEIKEKAQEWLSSYMSQNLIFDISINFSSLTWNVNIKNKFNTEELLSLDKLSTGTKNLISLISQVGDIDAETIVLIDEPETGMHPIMQIQFRDFIEKLSTKTATRFIVATHSLHFVKNGIETNGLYIVTNGINGSSIMSKKEYVENHDILDTQIFDMIGYYISKDNTSFNKGKPIIVVEGDTDIIYIKKMAKILNIDEGSFAMTRTKLGGAPNMAKTALLLSTIHDFPKKNIILSPDWDIVTKHPKVYKDLNDKSKSMGKLVMLGIEGGDVESLFDDEDNKYVSRSGNKNSKMNKANLFWRATISKKDLGLKTIANFTKYFKEVGLL